MECRLLPATQPCFIGSEKPPQPGSFGEAAFFVMELNIVILKIKRPPVNPEAFRNYGRQCHRAYSISLIDLINTGSSGTSPWPALLPVFTCRMASTASIPSST